MLHIVEGLKLNFSEKSVWKNCPNHELSVGRKLHKFLCLFFGLGPAPRFLTKLRNSNISDENVNPACDKFKQPFNNGKNHGR